MHPRRLVTAAVLALASAVPAAAPAPAHPSPAAPPPDAPAAPARPAGHTEVPVRSGSAVVSVPAALLAALAADGVTIAEAGTEGGARAGGEAGPGASAGHTDGGLRLRVKDGAVTNSGGKVGGELHFADSGMALTNGRTHTTVKVTDFEADLSQGTFRARVADGGHPATTITLGTFTRPGIRSSLDTRTAVLRLDAALATTAGAAAHLNAALGTGRFSRGGALLQAHVVASLDPSVDLATALNLG
ncbi:hypothetical protein ACGFOU_31895 [Streptomyces sp. NPDC048595]|uniref:hypothetical protein n=1 Tax=Streptomyces sp. NPDC048595 TaxID=3365576 RepID=UPI00371FB73D